MQILKVKIFELHEQQLHINHLRLSVEGMFYKQRLKR